LKWDLSTNESTKKPGHGNLIVGLSSINNKVYSTGWDDKLNSLDGTSSLEIPEQPKSVASNDELIAVVTEGLLLAYKNDTKLYEVKLKNVGTTVGVSAEHIAVGFQNNSVSVYESKTGEHLFDLPALRSKPSYVSFSPNGEYVAVGDVSGKINLYDVAKKEIKTARWAFHTSKITSISWNKDNNYVATGSLDTNIIIYQVANPIKNIKFLNAHKEGVNTVEWISDDEIVTGGSDSTIKKWKVEF
jgi:WD40 repeat protein